ncbi:hypothetical protein JOQ06_016433, partial [Pogonophryne albipinna]
YEAPGPFQAQDVCPAAPQNEYEAPGPFQAQDVCPAAPQNEYEAPGPFQAKDVCPVAPQNEYTIKVLRDLTSLITVAAKVLYAVDDESERSD